MGNLVILTGFIGRDPRVAFTPAGVCVANFTLATHERWTDKATGQKREHTEWHRCVAWNTLGTIVAEYASKGRLVQVQGKLKTRDYVLDDGIKRYVTEIVVEKLDFLDSRKEEASTAPTPQPSNPVDAATQGMLQGVRNLQAGCPYPTDDDMPF